MKRREFMVVSLMGLGALFLPSEVRARTPVRSLKASSGKILGLAADGFRWEVRANLGSQYTILDIYQNQDSYFAKVSFQGHIFYLKSTDGATWYTSEWSAPPAWQYQTLEKYHG